MILALQSDPVLTRIETAKRDAGHEVDFAVEAGREPLMAEAESAQTIASDFSDGLKHLRQLSGASRGRNTLIYGGDEAYIRDGVAVYPWFVL